jgi:hypothetical protein
MSAMFPAAHRGCVPDAVPQDSVPFVHLVKWVEWLVADALELLLGTDKTPLPAADPCEWCAPCLQVRRVFLKTDRNAASEYWYIGDTAAMEDITKNSSAPRTATGRYLAHGSQSLRTLDAGMCSDRSTTKMPRACTKHAQTLQNMHQSVAATQPQHEDPRERQDQQ